MVTFFILALGLTLAEEPDGVTLPAGFHATVVADSLGSIRHLAVRSNGDIYVSTARDQDGNGKGAGIIALHLAANGKADQVEHFGKIDGGTGIRFYNGALYASSPSAVYRFEFTGNELVPVEEPQAIVDGMSTLHPGFRRVNRPIAVDGKGDLFVGLDASANLCSDPNAPADAKPVGLKPCPDLGTRAGIWRFDANTVGQKFPTDGDQVATGIRDIDALDWSPVDSHLYGIMHARDDSNKFWPNIVSIQDENNIADEMHIITKGTNFGWPYTYYDGVRKLRLSSPEYGGDGKTVAPAGIYDTPILTFQSRRAAPLDLVFYTGDRFPKKYRNGAFVVLHGTRSQNGYDVLFVPFNREGMAGDPTIFADGFAGFDHSGTSTGRPKYRPSGAAVGPDGALYVADSQVGRVWRIAYTGN